MSQTPPRKDSALDLEALSTEELERGFVTGNSRQNPEEEAVSPPQNRRCDSNHREILRQPFFLDR
jgi:hypothetical protein